MPELPEVETVVRDLRKKLVGRQIVSVKFLRRSIWRIRPPQAGTLINSRILSTTRKGKNILIALSNGLTLVFHLKMTGQLIVSEPESAVIRHTHLIISFEKCQLRFVDIRRFGYADLLPTKQLHQAPYLNKLGPDPFEISREQFVALLVSKNRIIKSLLLDQTIIAGIGNIYSDEALHLAGIHPRRNSSKISSRKLGVLFDSTIQVLTNSIRSRGTSISDYVDSAGRKGNFQNSLRVYSREGQPCIKCGRKIKRLIIGSRSSHFCPGCQR